MLARLFRQLAPFQPTLIGSFPLGLQVDGSDLDIACACDDLDAFERTLRTALSDLGIAQPRIERSPAPAVVAAFELGGVAIEIFGQVLPVTAQRGSGKVSFYPAKPTAYPGAVPQVLDATKRWDAIAGTTKANIVK